MQGGARSRMSQPGGAEAREKWPGERCQGDGQMTRPHGDFESGPDCDGTDTANPCTPATNSWPPRKHDRSLSRYRSRVPISSVGVGNHFLAHQDRKWSPESHDKGDSR